MIPKLSFIRSAFILFFCLTIFTACTGEWRHYPASAGPQSYVPLAIHSGDVLSVDIYGESDLSRDYPVLATGHIAMPLAGHIAVTGMDTATAAKAIEAALQNGYLVNPAVTVTLARTRSFSIVGEILKPGAYPYKDGMTALEAVATGGGFSYRANQNRFDIVRKGAAGNEELIEAGLSTPIRSGDVVRVRERFF